ncbi:MAG: hypothetical protein WDM96_09490 [Lacunisphaera sp.]
MQGTKIKVPVRKKARIEIIPLIDVIFFLLANFVLFTLSLNSIRLGGCESAGRRAAEPQSAQG